MNGLEIKIPDSLKQLGKIFERKRKSSIGVDVGSSNIKIVEIENQKGKMVLKNYALVKTSRDLIKDESSEIINNNVGKVVSNVFEKIGLKDRHINISVPSFASLITSIEIDPNSKKDIDQIVQYEVSRYIPVPLDEVVYGWQAVGEKEEALKKEGKKEDKTGEDKKSLASAPKKVVLVAIMKDISKKYETVFAKHGFSIESLEVDSFSLERSLIGKEKGNYLILDIGGKVCNMVLSYQGSLVLSRSIDVGGYKITQSIANAMKLNLHRAEKVKIEEGLTTKMIDLKNQVFLPLLDSIKNEVQKTADIFSKNYPGAKLDGIVLTGGSSNTKGMKEYFEEQMNLKVVYGNPWSKLEYPPQLEQTLVELSSSFGVAVGLALRPFNE